MNLNFVSTENLGAANASAASSPLKISVPSENAQRRIYIYMATDATSASPLFQAQLQFSYQGSPVGMLPVSIGYGVIASNNSPVSTYVSGGTNYVNAIGVTLQSNATYPNLPAGAVVLQPLNIDIICDTITLAFSNPQGGANWRAFLGCLSLIPLQ